MARAYQSAFPHQDKIKIRRMYLKGDMQPSAIAELIKHPDTKKPKYTPRQITAHVNYHGYPKIRKEAKQQVTNIILSAEDQQLKDVTDFEAEVSERGQELTLMGMDRAESATDGKDFSGFMNGAKAAFGMFRTAEGLDKQVVNHMHVNVGKIHGKPMRRVNSLKPSETTDIQAVEAAEVKACVDECKQDGKITDI